MTWEIRQGHVLDRLREMPDESVHCCVTSPPYWGLRDYGVDGQLGLEETPEQFVAKMVEVFAEVRRVLRADGTLWLNIGDSYSSGARSAQVVDSKAAGEQVAVVRPSSVPGLKPKDLVGIPWMLAFALRADGWYLRRDIIWAKPNPMPESVTDRPTSAHEYLFLLAKSLRYFYDAEAIRETATWAGQNRSDRGPRESAMPGAPCHNGLRQEKQRGHSRRHDGFNDRWAAMSKEEQQALGRNKRSVWTIATKPFPDAHFATFPPDLVEPCVRAGTSPKVCGECGAPWRRVTEVRRGGPSTVEGRRAAGGREAGHRRSGGLAQSPTGRAGGSDTRGVPSREVETLGWEPTCDHAVDSGRAVVLDPFAGAATTLLVAEQLRRDSIGIELNPEYVEIAEQRIRRWEHDPAGRLRRIEPVDGQGSIFDHLEPVEAGNG